MTIVYKIDKNEKKIKIIGKEFIKNKKGNCKLIIN